jgi:hypothetical protein
LGWLIHSTGITQPKRKNQPTPTSSDEPQVNSRANALSQATANQGDYFASGLWLDIFTPNTVKATEEEQPTEENKNDAPVTSIYLLRF